jgi:uncharacterized RDD family membrane protein YckC
MTTPPHGPEGSQEPIDPYATPQPGQYQPYPPPAQYGQPPQYGQHPYGAYPSAPAYSVYNTPQTGVGVPASMGSRLLARIIDGLIIGVPAAIVLGILIANVVHKSTCSTDQFGGERCTTNGGLGAVLLVYLLVFLVALFYELYFLGVKGATPGKMMLGIKVVDTQSGGPIGMGRAFLRYIVLAATGAVCTLGYWSPFFDGSRRYQGWHDKASNDFVVSTK